MSTGTRQPKPPRTERVRRPALTTGSPTGDSGLTREAEHFDGSDFSGLDLDFDTFVSCVFDRCRFDDTALRGVHLVECAMSGLDIPALSAPRSSWRASEITGSRWGSAELYESNWRSVVVADTKINFLNARTATWTDVIFRNCVIEELDLAYATVNRMVLQDCQVTTLDVSGATLSDVDLRTAELSGIKGLAGLRGAWISPDQLTRLAPSLADHLGLRIG